MRAKWQQAAGRKREGLPWTYGGAELISWLPTARLDSRVLHYRALQAPRQLCYCTTSLSARLSTMPPSLDESKPFHLAVCLFSGFQVSSVASSQTSLAPLAGAVEQDKSEQGGPTFVADSIPLQLALFSYNSC